MISRAEWELRQEQWRIFNEWEAANPPPNSITSEELTSVIPSKDPTPSVESDLTGNDQ